MLKISKIEATMLCLCFVTSLIFGSIVLNSGTVSAEQTPTIYIDPTPVFAYVCDYFTVNLNVKNVVDLYAWQIKLSFNPAQLECVSVTEGPFLKSGGPTIFPPPIINNTEGTILAGCSLMMGAGVSGTGTLAYIKFHCEGPGECDLVIDYPDTFLLDSKYNSIPRSAVKGHVIQKVFTRYLHKEEPLVPVHLHKEEPLQPVHIHPVSTFDPSNPLGSLWHELYPQYCTEYKLTSWNDTDRSGTLTSSDQIDLTNIRTGEVTWYHLDRLTWTIFIKEFEVPSPVPEAYAELEYPPKQTPPPIIDPVCTDWHVVHPPESYSRRFHIWSWIDNGDGVFGYCDYIDVEYRDMPGKIYYYHVEDLAMDLILTKKCFYEPISTEWHELYPTFSQYYHINNWEDTNGDHKLSASDQIDLHVDWPKFHHDNPLIGYSISTAPNTNATLWTYNTTAPVYSSPAILDNVLYIGSTNGIFYALNAQTGAVIWTYVTGGAIYSSPAVFYGKVYFLSTDGFIYALDAATGALVWSVLIDPPLPPRFGFWPWSSPAVHSGRVFIAASTGFVYCLNAFNGAIIWSTFVGGNPNSPIAVANNKVFTGTHNFDAGNATLVALNELTGAIIWTYSYTATHPGLVGMINCNGVAVTDGDGDGNLEVYFGVYIWPEGSLGNSAIALDEATGNEIWTQNINGCSTSTPAVHDGKVFIGSDDFKVYALNAATGAYVWTYSTKGPVWSAPAVADGKVFAGSLDHTLYALDENTGALIWSYNTSASRLYGSPAVACGKVFIGSENGAVYAFGPQENKVRWYHVDRVTVTILLKEKYVEYPIQLYAEFTGPFEMFYEPIMNPLNTLWHVVYPPRQYSRIFNITSWEDNGDGVFSFCDQIDVEYEDEPGVTHWYHVEEIACDIILTKKCFYDPIGSQWHELYPEFCRSYKLTSWKDTNRDGKLTPSDYIDLTDKKTGDVSWYHVDSVTLTIKITEKGRDPPVVLYAEFTGGPEMFFNPIMNPICTVWHVIYPRDNFSTYFHIGSWEDNGDGVLSYCDYIDVEYEHEPGVIHWYHVEEIACDLKISCKTGTVVAGSEDTNVYAWDFLGNLLWTTPTIAPVLSVAMDNDGNYVAAGSRVLGTYTGALYFIDASNGVILWAKELLIKDSYNGGWRGTESKSVDVKYNKYNNHCVIAAAHENGLDLYNQAGSLIWRYFDDYPETIVRISQDGNYIICASYLTGTAHYFSHLRDGTPGWQPGDGKPVWSVSMGKPGIFWAAISGLGDYVALSTQVPASVVLLDRTGSVIWSTAFPKPGYVRVDMPCDGKSLVAVNDDPSDSMGCDLLYWSDGCNGWDSGDSVPIWSFWPTWPSAQNTMHDFYTVAISGNGKTIATGGEPRFDYVLSNAGPPPLQTLGPRPDNPQSVDLTFAGEYGASVGGTIPGPGSAEVWFFSNTKGLLWTWTNPSKQPFHSVAISKIYPCMFPYPNHDVAITDVRTCKQGGWPRPVVCKGFTAHVNVTVVNQGEFSENFTVSVYANSSLIGIRNVVNLAAGSQISLIFLWDTTALAKGNYTITAYASIVQDEIDVYDNTGIGGWIQVTHPGDIAEPFGIVDMTDIGWICYSFGSGPSSPRWDPNRDIVDTHFIDMDDIGYACLHYGEQG